MADGESKKEREMTQTSETLSGSAVNGESDCKKRS